jgi:hypothetical protein
MGRIFNDKLKSFTYLLIKVESSSNISTLMEAEEVFINVGHDKYVKEDVYRVGSDVFIGEALLYIYIIMFGSH